MNAFSFVNKCVSNGYNKIMAAGEPVADVRAAMHSQGKKWNGTDLTW